MIFSVFYLNLLFSTSDGVFMTSDGVFMTAGSVSQLGGWPFFRSAGSINNFTSAPFTKRNQFTFAFTGAFRGRLYGYYGRARRVPTGLRQDTIHPADADKSEGGSKRLFLGGYWPCGRRDQSS
jgi:hypothetical protein